MQCHSELCPRPRGSSSVAWLILPLGSRLLWCLSSPETSHEDTTIAVHLADIKMCCPWPGGHGFETQLGLTQVYPISIAIANSNSNSLAKQRTVLLTINTDKERNEAENYVSIKGFQTGKRKL